MKISSNKILGGICSVILLLMIIWVVQIQTSDYYKERKYIFKKEKVTLSELSIERGKKIWRNNACTSCHKLHVNDGYPLPGIKERYSKEWLVQYIKDEQVLIDKEDPDVIALNVEWNSNKSEHKNPHFSEKNILDILNYIDGY